jgi:4-hydroxyphenylacetate 3-monooxygenase
VFRGNQALLGEIVAWRNMLWSFADTMAHKPDDWVEGTVLPNLSAAMGYRVFAPEAWVRIKDIVEKIVASALIYLPSSARDFGNPAIDPYLKRYVRGSNGIDYKERIKIMKLLWDAMGTEFGGRHELYERNYAGNHEEIRLATLGSARGNGDMAAMTEMVERCMADYDEHGWTGNTWIGPGA